MNLVLKLKWIPKCIRQFSTSSSQLQTHYERLGISRHATQDEIKQAFLEKSKILHPDASNADGKDTHGEFVELNQAYSVLSKVSTRNEYDSHTFHAAVQGHDYKQHGTVKASSIKNPHRSASYKSPYAEYEQARQTSNRWTDYTNPYGQSRAKRYMERDVKDQYWQKHWDQSRKFGGGGPQFASHDRSGMKKDRQFLNFEVKMFFGFIGFLIVMSLCYGAFIHRDPVDLEVIEREHLKWLEERRIKKD